MLSSLFRLAPLPDLRDGFPQKKKDSAGCVGQPAPLPFCSAARKRVFQNSVSPGYFAPRKGRLLTRDGGRGTPPFVLKPGKIIQVVPEKDLGFGQGKHKAFHVPAAKQIQMYPPAFFSTPAPASTTPRLDLNRWTDHDCKRSPIISNNFITGSKHPLPAFLPRHKRVCPFTPLSIITVPTQASTRQRSTPCFFLISHP